MGKLSACICCVHIWWGCGEFFEPLRGGHVSVSSDGGRWGRVLIGPLEPTWENTPAAGTATMFGHIYGYVPYCAARAPNCAVLRPRTARLGMGPDSRRRRLWLQIGLAAQPARPLAAELHSALAKVGFCSGALLCIIFVQPRVFRPTIAGVLALSSQEVEEKLLRRQLHQARELTRASEHAIMRSCLQFAASLVDDIRRC